jgi:type IX secretion system PorP/SprF family membrane protein
MKKIIILLMSVAYFCNTSNAQEEAIFMHYTFNPVLINPAATGFDPEHHDIFINIRSAWSGFPDAPKTYALSYNGPIGNRLGLGGMIFSENVAALSRVRAQLSYSFRFQIKDVNMAFGLSTEWHRMQLSNSISNSDFYDDYIGDTAIEDAMNGTSEFDASVGLYGSYKRKVFFGIAAPGLVRNKLESEKGGDLFKYYTVNVGGEFELNDSKVKLIPSILLKKVRNVDFQADLNLLATFLNEQLITGLTYRGGTGGNLGITLGTKYSALRVVYTYDIYMGDFQKYNGGSHEITINFSFNRVEGNYDRSAKYRQ